MPMLRVQPAPVHVSSGRDPEQSSGRINARRVAIGMLALGLVITALATWWSLERRTRSDAEELAVKGELLVFGVSELLGDVGDQTAAGGSLFRSSEHVSASEFHIFVDDTGLMTGVLGLGYVPVVPNDELVDWLTATRAELPGLEVFQLDSRNLPATLQPRDLRFPLLYFEPFELFSGFAGLELGFHEAWYEDLASGIEADGITMTAFVEFGLPSPLDDGDQFIIGWPIADVGTGKVEALAVALVDLGMLIDANLSDEVTDGIDWQVADLVGADPVADVEPGIWSGSLEFGRRTWVFTVAMENPDGGLFAGTAVYPFAGGLAITVLLAAVGQLAVGRSSSRRRVETLESLNQGKDEFLAAVSHRLRTPLTAVVGFSEVLSDSGGALTEDDRRELLSTIAVQAIELGHLFDNLLTVTRDTKRALFSPSRVTVASEVHAVLDTVEPSRRAKVRVVAADPELAVAGDPGLVRQILRNLIANATDFGNQVEMTIVDDDCIAGIVVCDDGPGVPASRAESIFDLYDHSTGDRGQPNSMGVGLFVSRRLARRMSGDITYRRDGKWTVFELSLPALPAPVSVTASADAATVG